ncbi:4'-phosphopantetheinyl transferase family protein [Streptomyces ovatisporus]|uniref:4'-phosphopantetheinyl transferase family protein n=1 Tax=Streptomyces ovatisporus TaxID=1128682 RepID=A0ABV9AFC4_9ACTN
MPEQRPEGGRFAATRAVHVWYGRGADELGKVDLTHLDDGELRLVRSRRPPLDAHYGSAHAAVRRVLADHYLGGPPSAITFGRHVCPRCGDPSHGRPRISSPVTGLEFSLSRTGPHWALAVTAGERVGIDIECGAGRAVDGAAEVALSDGELARLRAVEHAAGRREFFLRAWTRKEAVLKAAGTGIVAGMRALEVRPAQRGTVRVENAEAVRGDRPRTWLVDELALGDGLFAALAREEGRCGPVVLRPVTRTENGAVAV